MRLWPARVDGQLAYEQTHGLGQVTYSLDEFLAELGSDAEAVPTFDRLALFKREYRRLTP